MIFHCPSYHVVRGTVLKHYGATFAPEVLHYFFMPSTIHPKASWLVLCTKGVLSTPDQLHVLGHWAEGWQDDEPLKMQVVSSVDKTLLGVHERYFLKTCARFSLSRLIMGVGKKGKQKPDKIPMRNTTFWTYSITFAEYLFPSSY